MMRPLVAAAAIALLFGACSGQSTSVRATPLPSPSPSPSPIALPDSWSVHADNQQGFSVATPDAWELAIRDSPTFDADVRTVADHSAKLGQYVTDAFAKHDQLRLLAADSRSLQQGFATNINVMISDLGAIAAAPTLNDVVGAKLKRLQASPDTGKPLQQHRDSLSGVAAVRVDYPLTANGNPVLVRSILATLERGGRRYLVELTMGAAPDLAQTLFTAEQRLFRLFTPPTPVAAPSAAPRPRPSASASSQSSSG